MPLIGFVLVALFAIGGMAAVEYLQIVRQRPYYREKLDASKLALAAMSVIKQERIERDVAIDPETDPSGSGLIGSFVSPVTTDAGDLEAKQASVNPNFAAVVVDLLRRAKVKPGDPVAVGVSGSFPAINIAVYAAVAALHLQPTIISSVGASQWGANDPSFVWIDMEAVLHDKGIFPFRSTAASMGGKNDKAREITAAGRAMILSAIKRNGLQLVRASNVREDIDDRMAVYFRRTAPKAYINVGGGVASTGVRSFKRFLRPGLILADLPTDPKTDSVINRFLKERTPVIHIENVKQLARHYGLPLNPDTVPRVGEGDVYYHRGYNRWLAGAVLLGIAFGLYIFGRVDWGFRMLRASAKREVGPPEPMV